jgi:hypothetical protein
MSTLKVDGIRSNSATSDAITLASNGTCTANITNNLSNRNLIINGAMNVAQRGTSSTSSGYATLDRFRLAVANTDQAAYTQKQVSDSPDDFSQSYEFDVTTAETSLDSNEYAFIGHRIEAQNLQSVKANQVTLSFYVKAYQTGTYAINIYQQDGNIHITKTYTISQSGTWEKKTLTFAANTGTQPNNDNGFGWEIAWIMAAGSGVKSSDSTSWGTYSDAGFAFGQGVNVLSSTDNYFKITGVQLEVGSVATDFEHRSFGQELALCQRYYYKDPDISHRMADGQVACNTTGAYTLPVGSAHPTTMRANPTLTLVGVTYSGCSFNSSNANTMAWGMRVTTDNTSQFRITTGSATFDAEL